MSIEDESYDESDMAADSKASNAAKSADSGDETADREDEIADVDTSKKIIRNMKFSVETTDLDALNDTILQKTSELGGYVESSETNGKTRYDDAYYLGDDGYTYYDSSYASRGKSIEKRYAYYTIRIPAENLDQFAETVEDSSNVTSNSTSVQDITSTYVDTDSRRKSLEEEQASLNTMMKKAESIEEMIQIEDKLSDVRYNLQNIKSQLASMQNNVAYSTVTINVTEVTVLTDTTSTSISWTERIANGFTTSCETVWDDFTENMIWLLSNIPMILYSIVRFIFFVALAGIAIKVISFVFKKCKKFKIQKKVRVKTKNKVDEHMNSEPITVDNNDNETTIDQGKE